MPSLDRACLPFPLAVCIVLIPTVVLCYLSLATGKWYPYSDEWNLVPYLANGTNFTAAYVWEPHNEHRIVIPKLIWKLLYPYGQQHYQVFTSLNTLLFALAAIYILSCLRDAQGKNHVADLSIPLLLLSGAQGSHYWGFMLQHVLTAVLLSVVLVALLTETRTQADAHRRAAIVALSMVAMTLIGINGVIPALCLALAVLVMAVQRHWQKKTLEKSEANLLVGATVTVWVAGLVLQDFRIDHTHQSTSPLAMVDRFFRIVSSTAGELSPALHLVVAILFVGYSLGALVLLWDTLCRRKPAGGQLTSSPVVVLGACLAVLLLPVSVAVGRGASTWDSNHIYHYSFCALPLLLGIFLVIRQGRAFGGKSLVLSGVLAYGLFSQAYNASFLVGLGEYRQSLNEEVRNRLVQGGCVEDLLNQHVAWFYFVENDWSRRTVRKGMLALKQAGVPDYQHIVRCYGKPQPGI